MIDKHDPELLGLAIRECKSKYGCSITQAADTVFDWLSQGMRLYTLAPPASPGTPPYADMPPGEARENVPHRKYNPTIIDGEADQGGTGDKP